MANGRTFSAHWCETARLLARRLRRPRSLRDDPELALVVGGKPVAEHLQAAIDRGDVLRERNGRLRLRLRPEKLARLRKNIPFITSHDGDFAQPCFFLNKFVFQQAYGESAVPINCRDCYKVKVVTDSLRQMMAVNVIASRFPQTAKSGAEAFSTANPHRYGTYFYNIGLDRARALYSDLRAVVDAHPLLGPGTKMLIKRGCTNYEQKCGPSDKYTFDPRLERIEAYLAKLFRVDDEDRRLVRSMSDEEVGLKNIIDLAYRIGDETYTDFTGGRPLNPPLVNYGPDGDESASAGFPARSVSPSPP